MHTERINEAELIDGRHRVKACQELNVDYQECEIEEGYADPFKWVISTNLHRRHLTERPGVLNEARKLFERCNDDQRTLILNLWSEWLV